MTSVYTTDWAFSVMHIWSNLQVHTVPGTDPRKGFSAAKAAQLLTQMAKEGSSQSYSRYFNRLIVGISISTMIRKKQVSHKTVCNLLILDLLVLVYVSIVQSADPN